MSRPVLAIAVVLAFAVAPRSLDATSLRLAAVLPIQSVGAPLPEDTRALLEDALRTEVGAGLYPLGFTVLNRDTVLTLAAENGVDVGKLCEASCALDMARELKAQAFVSSSLARDEGRVVLIVRLFDAETGQQLGSYSVDAATPTDLRQALPASSKGFFSTLAGRDGQVQVSFESMPAGARVLVDGREACAQTPCSARVAGGPRKVLLTLERHDDVELTRFLADGARVSGELLPAFGLLALSTVPEGAELFVDGDARGKADRGPIELRRGEHVLELRHACSEPTTRKVLIPRAGTLTEHVALTPKTVVVEVSARDDHDAVDGALVLADGERVGFTPGVARVPVCTKELVAQASDGRRGSAAPHLDTRDGQAIALELPPPAWALKHFALRAGLGSHNGVLGVGLEYRSGLVGFAVGSGIDLVSGGVTFAFGQGRSGPYVDLHGAWGRRGPMALALNRFVTEGFGVGATAGWDLRLAGVVSLKAGVGVAWNSARFGQSIPLVWDLSIGPVF